MCTQRLLQSEAYGKHLLQNFVGMKREMEQEMNEEDPELHNAQH